MANPSSATESIHAGFPSAKPPEGPPRAPLLWIALGLVPGYLGAATLPQGLPSELLLVASIGFLALAWKRASSRLAWTIGFLCSIACLAAVWFQERTTNAPDIWSELPPREIFAEAHILEVFPGKTYPDRQYALVELIRTPPLMAELAGQRAFASLKRDEAHPLLHPGEVHALHGVVAPVDPSEAAGGFNRFLNARGAHFRLRQGRSVEVIAPAPAWRSALASLAVQWTAWLTAAPEPYAHQGRLLGAMLMGERSLLDPAQEEAFLLSGTMHLFAISGLHVMLVALTLQQILNLVRVPRRWGFLVVLLLLFVYVGATGFSPSAVRAASMLAFYWLAGLLLRRPRPLPAVVASAVVVLLVDPGQLWDLGFQLSYSVVLGILLLGLPMAECWNAHRRLFRFVLTEDLRPWQRALIFLRKRTIDSLCISFAATISSAPLIVLYFGIWTPGAILLNALLIPLASLVVATGVFIILSATVGLGAVAGFLLHAAWLLLLAMGGLVQAAITIPGMFSEREWLAPAAAYGALLTFLLWLLVGDLPARGKRLSPIVRHGLPVAWALCGLWLGTFAI